MGDSATTTYKSIIKNTSYIHATDTRRHLTQWAPRRSVKEMSIRNVTDMSQFSKGEDGFRIPEILKQLPSTATIPRIYLAYHNVLLLSVCGGSARSRFFLDPAGLFDQELLLLPMPQNSDQLSHHNLSFSLHCLYFHFPRQRGESSTATTPETHRINTSQLVINPPISYSSTRQTQGLDHLLGIMNKILCCSDTWKKDTPLQLRLSQ